MNNSSIWPSIETALTMSHVHKVHVHKAKCYSESWVLQVQMQRARDIQEIYQWKKRMTMRMYLVPTWGTSQANNWETMCMARWEHKTSMERASGTSGEWWYESNFDPRGSQGQDHLDSTGHRMQTDLCPPRLFKDRDLPYLTIYPEGRGQDT